MNARVALISVTPVEAKGKITDPISLKISFEAYEDLPSGEYYSPFFIAYNLEIEFEVIVAWDGNHGNDQVLDSIEVGPVKAGQHDFVLDVSCVCFFLFKSYLGSSRSGLQPCQR
jgi:hypothetical protein